MGDKFYVTLSEADQALVQECLQAGLCTNAGDLIRQGIALSHQQLTASRTGNQKLQAGLTSLCQRLERYTPSRGQ